MGSEFKSSVVSLRTKQLDERSGRRGRRLLLYNIPIHLPFNSISSPLFYTLSQKEKYTVRKCSQLFNFLSHYQYSISTISGSYIKFLPPLSFITRSILTFIFSFVPKKAIGFKITIQHLPVSSYFSFGTTISPV